MLYRETVDATTWKLVRELSEITQNQQFYLVGGTALALQFGHRISVDLDFFTTQAFDVNTLRVSLESKYQDNLQWTFEKGHALGATINGVKVDFLRHDYPIIKPLEEEGISMLSSMDIAAMKLNAVAKRGSIKDFFDIYELLESYSLAEMLDFFKSKYQQTGTAYILRSLTYFEDAELESQPQSIKQVPWREVKSKIRSIVEMHFQ